ncbi:MAG: MerR family transcriptional regulator [Chloroflexi bacterium]|nr:MerR family transcriptional regulator [Chloroflexota bacterium]
MVQGESPGSTQDMETNGTPTRRCMQIGEVAERTGLTQRTLRYYESIGLLAPASRMEGGFRLYTEDDVRRLEQIVELKKLLGFTLAEIRQIVDADELLQQIRQENKLEPDPLERRLRLERAVRLISEQLDLVRSRIAAMRSLQDRYERRLERLRGRLASLERREDERTPVGSTT